MNKHEKRLYLANSLSQQLILLYILGNTAFTIFYVVNMAVEVQLGIFVMVNIALSLIAFLTAVRQKNYDIRWGYVGIALGLFQLIRLIWMPEELTGSLRILLIALLLATSGLALAGSIISVKRSQERQKFITENNIDLALLQK